MVGFEQSSYSITEGTSEEICVVVIGPDDIGRTQVFLEVLPTENPAGVGNEAG